MSMRVFVLGVGSFTVALASGCTNSTGVVCPADAGNCGAPSSQAAGGGSSAAGEGGGGGPAPASAPDDASAVLPNDSTGVDAGGSMEVAPEAAAPAEASLGGPSPAGDAGAGPQPGPAGTDSGAQGTNLVTDGDFSQPSSPLWAIVAGAGTISVSNSELCVSVAASGQATLGWPQPAGSQGAVLASGTSYTFSYKARATQPLNVDAKIGESNSPYTADFESQSDSVTTSLQTFTHTFTPSQADSSAGVAFAFMAGSSTNQVCFEAVGVFAN